MVVCFQRLLFQRPLLLHYGYSHGPSCNGEFGLRLRRYAAPSSLLDLKKRSGSTCFPGDGILLYKSAATKCTHGFNGGNSSCNADEPAQRKEHFYFLWKILKDTNSILPQVVLASTLLSLMYPPSFTWFTTRYYAPALGFLMFAVGVNSSEKDFVEAFEKPKAIVLGYFCQYAIKPLFGYIFSMIALKFFHLPTSVGAGIMLTSCVSGAQLANYATYLTDPTMAPLSIVMTSLSTATAIFVTPFLSLLLIGKKLPVDVGGMMSSILQIILVPVASGLLLNRFFPGMARKIRPFLPLSSVFVTSLCVGSPLALNIKSVLSPYGVIVLLHIVSFHAVSFIAGYTAAGVVFNKSSEAKAFQRTISFAAGMQSSLLALALANRFFDDPLVGIPPAISVVVMSLMGFSLVMLWTKRRTSL